MSDASLQLLIAVFDEETAAEEALKTLKESQDEKLAGIQGAVSPVWLLPGKMRPGYW